MDILTAIIVVVMFLMLLPFAFRVYSSNEAKREEMRSLVAGSVSDFGEQSPTTTSPENRKS